MIRLTRKKSLFGWALALLAVGAFVGCSTDSPTAPTQTPIPPGSGGPSAAWNLSVSVSPRSIEVGSPNPANITVDVRRADNNQRPASGTTIVLSTNLGDFDAPNSGIQSIALTTINGRAGALWFPGAVLGDAVFVAQLENSAGRATANITDVIEPIVASFAIQNSEQNLSIRFQDTSTGDPTDFLWDFGDGSTSKEQNPAHLYALPGDYVVTLTASKKGSSDTTSRPVTVTKDPLLDIAASFAFTANELRVAFRDLSTGNPTSWVWDFGDGTGSRQQNPTHDYVHEGTYVVTLTASNQSTEDTTSNFVVVELDSPDVFISAITPNSGPASGGTVVTVSGVGFLAPLRVSFGGVLGTVSSSTFNSIVVTTPPGVLATGPCNDDADAVIGVKVVDTAVPVTVDLADGSTATVPGGFTYLAPPAAPCNGD